MTYQLFPTPNYVSDKPSFSLNGMGILVRSGFAQFLDVIQVRNHILGSAVSLLGSRLGFVKMSSGFYSLRHHGGQKDTPFHRAYQYLLKTITEGYRVLLNQFLNKVVSFYSFIFHLIFSQSGQPFPLQKKQVKTPSISEQQRSVCSYGTLNPSKCLWQEQLHLVKVASISLMTKLTNNWSFQHFLNRPTASDTIFKKSSLKSFFSRPLSKRFRFAFIGKQVIVRAVQVLIPQSVPSAIFFGIIFVGIYAVNGGVFLSVFFTMFLVALVHILLKLLKINPTKINTNTSPTVILKTIMTRIGTALLHSTPYLIKPSSRHSVFHSPILANGGMIVNQFYTHIWKTRSQLTDLWNKAHNK